jgi:DNA-binding MarR family transcriptional regulator
MNQVHREYFELFNEISIIAQLTRTIMEQSLPDGMTQPHFSVLNHLVRLGDGVSPRDLSCAFQVPKSSMTNTLAGLEKRGLIEVRPNPNDARGKYIFLTRAGRDFRQQAIDALAPNIDEIAEQVSLHEVHVLLPALRDLRQVLDENRAAQPNGASSPTES